MLQRTVASARILLHLRRESAAAFHPLNTLLDRQSRNVRNIVAYAFRYVPYYRETLGHLGLTPYDFRVADDLARLPILERRQLQRDPEYYVSKAAPLEDYLLVRSAGTSGSPCPFFCDAPGLWLDSGIGGRARTPIVAALGRRGSYRQTTILVPGGASAAVHDYLQRHTWLGQSGTALRQRLSLFDPPAINAALMDTYRPQVLLSLGSYVASLFAYLQSSGKALHLPAAVRYTSDPLPPESRRAIEEELGIPVFGTYAATEALSIGFECEEHSGLHLNIDYYPLRLVDGEGRSVPTGQGGEVIVSNLVNRGTVLLNYRLQDVACMHPGPCTCGRASPLLSRLLGRDDDWLRAPSGRWVHPEEVNNIFRYEVHVWQHQVVQETDSCFRIRLVVSPDCDRVETSARVRREFQQAVGGEARLDIEFAEALPVTPSGKVRPVVGGSSRSQSEPIRPRG